MNYIEYLEYLIDIGIDYNKYFATPQFFFTECLGGDCSAIIKDLYKLIEKPFKQYTKTDWEGVMYILSKTKIKGGK